VSSNRGTGDVTVSVPTCARCPFGAECRGGAVALAPGFTRVSTDGTASLRMCVPPSACLGGGGNGTCASGYAGRDCGMCAPGHYRLLMKCEPCSASHTMWRAVLLCLFPLLLVALLTTESLVTARGATLNGRNRRAAGWIALFAIQTLALVPMSLTSVPPWPRGLDSAMAAATGALFNVELAAHECFADDAPMTFAWRYAVGMLSPIAVMASVPLIVGLALAVRAGLCTASAGGPISEQRTTSKFEPPVSALPPSNDASAQAEAGDVTAAAPATVNRAGYAMDPSAPFGPVTPPDGSPVHPRAHRSMRRRAMASMRAAESDQYTFADHTWNVLASVTLLSVLPLMLHALSPLACVYHRDDRATRLRDPSEECWGNELSWTEMIIYGAGFIAAILIVLALAMAVLMHGKGNRYGFIYIIV
jgi:hypothetical protein